MNIQCDLHLHSRFSPDAQESPEKLVLRARAKKLKAIAIADHNTIGAMFELKKFAQKNNVVVVEGIEISCRLGDFNMHVLGYAKNFNKKIIEKKLIPTNKGYNLRAKKLFSKCQKAGLIQKSINFTSFQKNSKKIYIPTRYIHILISRHLKISLKEAEEMTKPGTKYYVKMPSTGVMLPQDATKVIKNAGGLSVLAHPYYIVRNEKAKKNPEKYLSQIIKTGKFKGLEVYYPKHTKEEIKLFLKIAKKHNLLITGGSDWHGPDFTAQTPVGCQGINYLNFKKLLKALN